MALPHVFPMPFRATFIPALPVPLPPLSADALDPAQSLEKERRRAGSSIYWNGHDLCPFQGLGWQGTQNSSFK